MAGEQVVRVDGRRVRLSNLDKVLYPETGTTKGEVIDYYSRVAPRLIPHVLDRPVTRKRWPDGVGTASRPGESFFAKHLEPGAPAWVARRPIEHSTGAKDYPLVDDRAILVYLAQVASLELHVPQWRFDAEGDRRNPDRLVLDLDPGPGVGLAECAEVARLARSILDGVGLHAAPVTSGSKGIHLYCALDGRQTSDQASLFAKELARALEADHPDLVVSAMAKSARAGRVFVDWSQNNGSKTTIAPYSLRGRAHPTVAAPRSWGELDDPDLRQLDLTDMLDRLEPADDSLLAAGIDSPRELRRLESYVAKRSPKKTPEPFPGSEPTPQDAGSRFVIQEHHASRLHWDLRLEHDGVLVSWAVPRGVPPTPQRNNLAIMTEDHPLQYLDFEGEIPAGQYGAGTMTVWDSGHYRLEKWRDDEIIATLTGRQGGPLGVVRLALIRTDGAGEKSTWLLHRMKSDEQGRPQAVGGAVAPRQESSAHEAHTAPLRPMLAALGDRALARDAISRARAAGEEPWVEFKWDGVRAIARWRDGRLRLWGRRGNEITARYPELAEAELTLDAETAVLDGEIVALDAQGAPSFSLLQNRMHLADPHEARAAAKTTPVRLYLYDVTEVDSDDLSRRPLRERRAVLERITRRVALPLVVPPVVDDLDVAWRASHELGLEGVVIKRASSPYRAGTRSDDWLKLKIVLTQEVVVGGIRPGKGGRTGSIGSLLLGVPTNEGLQYVGRVGSGFTDATLRELDRVLAPLRTDQSSLIGVPAADASDAQWVRPEVVAEVAFSQWTPTGSLRHARWRGLRPDKAPGDVVRES